jgi:polar amino acid transport system substrate-binding protein
VSMTCDRWKSVLFSTPYFNAHTKVQVRANDQGTAVFADGTPIGPTATVAELNEALSARRVCATKGSTSIGIIESKLPDAIPVAVPTRTDCLMQLQNGTVDAISTHDTFLLGFREQDPDTTILEPTLNEQPYGIAIAKDHPDFVRFVNGVIEKLLADGTMQGIYDLNFGPCKACEALHDVLPSTEPPWLD